MPRLHGDEPHSYVHSQASTARNQKSACREEEGTNQMACLKRLPPKAAFNNNDIYAKNTGSGKNLYEEPQEKREVEEEQEPKEKNMRGFFYKLNINGNTSITSTPHEEEYDDQN